MGVQLAVAEDGVDGGHDAVHPIALGDYRIVHQGVDDGRRIGEARGFYQNAPKLGHLAAQTLDKKLAQGIDQVAAHRAADAARIENDDVLADRFDQQVVEADVAEFVDQDRCFLHVRMAEEVVEQCRFAAAQKPGDDGDRDRGVFGHGGLAHQP